MFERVRPGDPRLTDYERLRDPDLARRRGLFVAEGRLVVERLILQERYTFRSILVSDAAARQLAAPLSRVDGRVSIFVCEATEFVPIAGYNVHRGCLALVERPAPRPLASVIAGGRTVVVLEGVANPDNIGGVFRNAAAFGADAVVLSPTCCDPLYRKAIRTSMAATLAVPFARATAWPDALGDLRAAGFALLALTPAETAEDLESFARRGVPRRVALLIGTEGTGLSDAALATADDRVRIPIQPAVDSLNLAAAAGIALYRLAAAPR